MTDDPREFYKATTLRVLGLFQLLEFALKAYIAGAYAIIRKTVESKVHFDYSAKDLVSFPLERLLNVFAKLNRNKELIDRLNKLRDERNHIAHKSLLATMGRMYDPAAVEDRNMVYSQLEDELNECLQLLLKEMHLLKKPPDAV